MGVQSSGTRSAYDLAVLAAVVRAPHAPMSIENLHMEAPRDDEVVVKLVATGVCHTDIAMRDQVFPVPQPIVLGHEGAGIVLRTGRGVTKVSPGDPVVMTYNSCGQCPNCYSKRASYCHDFFGRNFAGARDDGSTALRCGSEQIHSHFFGQSSFSTHALCRERNVVRVPAAAPLELLGPLACGIQTGAGAVLNALRMNAGESLVVFGVGSVGLSAIMAARLVGARVIVAVDLLDERLRVARELGATHCINGRTSDIAASIKLALPVGANYALETTGMPTVIRSAVESLAPLGICGLLGATKITSEMTLNVAHLMTAGRTVRGIIEGDSIPELFIPTLIDLYLKGQFPFDRLIQFYRFDQINQAMADSESGRTIKAIVRMP